MTGDQQNYQEVTHIVSQVGSDTVSIIDGEIPGEGYTIIGNDVALRRQIKADAEWLVCYHGKKEYEMNSGRADHTQVGPAP